jgi:AraC-like DNA-binding protein
MTHSFVEIRTYLAEATLHRHDFHQIVLPQRGHLELEVEGCGGRVQHGVGAFIVAGEKHAFLAKGDNGFLVIDLPVCESGSDPLASSFNRRAFFVIEPPIQGLVDYATAMLGTAAPSAVMQTHWAPLVIEGLARDRHLPPNLETAALGRAKAFMRAHLAKPVRITDIAAAAGLSSTRLYALFRKHDGQSPHAALLQLRIDSARHLLIETNLSIAEIAVRTGHADQSALTRRVRETLGVTPAALRRANQSGSTN